MSFFKDIIISQANKNDVPAIISLWEKTKLTRPWNDPAKDIELSLNADTSTIFTARKNGSIVGSAMTGYDGHRGWIYYLAVDPDCQKQGIGKRLYNEAYRWLKEQGAPKFQILIRNDNEDVVSFYEKLGFEKSTSLLMARKIEE